MANYSDVSKYVLATSVFQTMLSVLTKAFYNEGFSLYNHVNLTVNKSRLKYYNFNY